MQFIDIARVRYSCRDYLPEKVRQEHLSYILEAGRIAPSAANRQPWIFIVVESEAQRSALYESYDRDWFKTAPCVLVICGDHSISWKRNDGKDHCDVDASITTDHMTLAAAELGLGTCWICNFNRDACKQALGLPGHIEPIAMLSLGYPADKGDPGRHEGKRKPLSSIVHYEQYGSQRV
jgi:nitroreductase